MTKTFTIETTETEETLRKTLSTLSKALVFSDKDKKQKLFDEMKNDNPAMKYMMDFVQNSLDAMEDKIIEEIGKVLTEE